MCLSAPAHKRGFNFLLEGVWYPKYVNIGSMPFQSWVAGNEVIVKNVNANIPVSLPWLLLPFLAFFYFEWACQDF